MLKAFSSLEAFKTSDLSRSINVTHTTTTASASASTTTANPWNSTTTTTTAAAAVPSADASAVRSARTLAHEHFAPMRRRISEACAAHQAGGSRGTIRARLSTFFQNGLIERTNWTLQEQKVTVNRTFQVSFGTYTQTTNLSYIYHLI